ncbi:hypothetical protein IHN32_15055 [Deinococcus sp. 14RED07]|uniref:polymorphic toxin-type HINT domain-containing protein n=1 Tax=Deinococcus sp. 14RED07 TaxID=2745874 RepID=UPI001E3F9A3D|nr:polymorphic toxin-type HINT domain-containing protein [Deinococcus sp. 14RED07]MCD0177263.1 hypothetical protein [Deinococcus sp. 14RED07]
MIPGHLFFFAQPVDTQPRPAPEGHGDLSRNWVGAGHLKIGDTIKQADGTTGLVANVTTVGQTREMFNLTVSEAHTYYVGQEGWLVHNCGPSLTRWGYTGTKDYDAVVNAVKTNTDTLQTVGAGKNAVIATRQEAEKLIADAGGRVLRVERGHAAPNPHDYPHINYTIDGKNVLTIRVEGVGRQYYAPGQKGYPK